VLPLKDLRGRSVGEKAKWVGAENSEGVSKDYLAGEHGSQGTFPFRQGRNLRSRQERDP